MTSADFMASFTGEDFSALEKAQAFERMGDARDAAAEQREQAEREAAREERLEALHFANRQAGNPLGELQRARAAFGVADDECRDLEAQLAKAQGKRDRAEGNVRFFAERSAEASGMAQRSAPGDMLAEAKRALTDAQREAAAQRVDAMLAAGSARPKGEVARSRGYAADEQPVHCPECGKLGATWEESVMIHKQAEMANVDLPQRSGTSHGPMIFR